MSLERRLRKLEEGRGTGWGCPECGYPADALAPLEVVWCDLDGNPIDDEEEPECCPECGAIWSEESVVVWDDARSGGEG